MHSIPLPSGRTAIFNGDLSGDIIIKSHRDNIEHIFPSKDLFAIVAYFVRNHRISQLEDMSNERILGIEP